MRRAIGGLVLAVVVGGCGGSGSTPPADRDPSQSVPLPSGLHGATSGNILGLWKPTGRGGQTSAAFVMFNPGGTWSGSDGCNAINGEYTLGADGRIAATSGPSTLIGCENWPGPGWVSQSGRVAVSGDRLVLFDGTGKRLGAMVKAGSTDGS